MSARAILSLLLIALGGASAASVARERAQPAPRIEQLEARRHGDGIAVSYTLADLLPDEAIERVHSGITLRFRHKIEIAERRPGLFVGDRSYAKASLEVSATYDSLTQRYELVRTVRPRGRGTDESADALEQRAVVESEREMRAWLTEVRDVELSGPAQPIEEAPGLTVRVEVVLGRRWFLLVIPTSATISAERELPAGG